MKANASAPKGRVDLRDRCRRLDLTATCEDEERFLSALHRTLFLRGGTITATPNGGEPHTIEFGDVSGPAGGGGAEGETNT